MSLIEFFLIPWSIVLGLALARFLEGLYVATGNASGRYWVHAVWLVNKFVQIVVQIWAVKGILESQPQTVVDLLILMAVPALLFLQALALVGLHPNESTDWCAHFFANRVRFFVLNLAYIGTLAMGIDRFGIDASIAALLPMVAFSIVGAVSADRRVHAFIAIVSLIGVLAGLGVPILATNA